MAKSIKLRTMTGQSVDHVWSTNKAIGLCLHHIRKFVIFTVLNYHISIVLLGVTNFVWKYITTCVYGKLLIIQLNECLKSNVWMLSTIIVSVIMNKDLKPG
jgi:hypothetical protein